MVQHSLFCRLSRFFYHSVTRMIWLLLLVLAGFSEHAYAGPLRPPSEPKSRLFLITVIDSDDKIIGKRCEKDLEEITASFEEFTLWLDMTRLVHKEIKGQDFGKAAVNQAIDVWLAGQEPSAEDIVVFYYSGHGFRLEGDASVYPRMWLKTSTDEKIETTSLSLEEDIFNRIVKMGAGVNIVLSDCCNSVPGAHATFAVSMASAKPRPPRQEELAEDMKDFDQLFLPDEPMSLIATAADSTELAGGTPDAGGFFTHYFLEALDKSIYDDDLEPTWENILNYAREESRKKALAGACPDNKHNGKGRCVQIAKFEIRSAANRE
jgi:Caspase domain